MTETRTASNGRTISPDEGGRWKDEDGNYGYCAHFTKDWRCYTCGAMCDCVDNPEDELTEWQHMLEELQRADRTDWEKEHNRCKSAEIQWV